MNLSSPPLSLRTLFLLLLCFITGLLGFPFIHRPSQQNISLLQEPIHIEQNITSELLNPIADREILSFENWQISRNTPDETLEQSASTPSSSVSMPAIHSTPSEPAADTHPVVLAEASSDVHATSPPLQLSTPPDLPHFTEEGPMPPLQLEYLNTLGVTSYIREIQHIGALFVRIDRNTQRIVGAINPLTGHQYPISEETLRSYSPRSREVHDLPPTSLHTEERIVLLVPHTIENLIQHNLRNILNQSTLPPNRILAVRGAYHSASNGLTISFDELVLSDNTRYPLSHRLTLPTSQ